MNTTNGNAPAGAQSDPASERAVLCDSHIEEAMQLLHCARRMLDLDDLNGIDKRALGSLLVDVDAHLLEASECFDGDEARIVRPDDSSDDGQQSEEATGEQPVKRPCDSPRIRALVDEVSESLPEDPALHKLFEDLTDAIWQFRPERPAAGLGASRARR